MTKIRKVLTTINEVTHEIHIESVRINSSDRHFNILQSDNFLQHVIKYLWSKVRTPQKFGVELVMAGNMAGLRHPYIYITNYKTGIRRDCNIYVSEDNREISIFPENEYNPKMSVRSGKNSSLFTKVPMYLNNIK